MKTLFVVVLALLCGQTFAAEKTNVLILHTDEQNFRTLGCYRALLPKEASFAWGDGIAVETPHIDSIAKRGALCDRFYAASPVCTPSRASFVSGRYPQNTGAPVNDKPMNDDVVTFAEALRRHGYATGYAGKWHLDGDAKPGWTPSRQFGFQDNRYMFNRGHWKEVLETSSGPSVNERGLGDKKTYTTDFLADKAASFIQAHKDKPFCYMVSFPDPHGPNRVRSPYDTMFDSFKFQLPLSAKGQGRMENMSWYFGMVKCLDDNIGKILDALRAAGLMEKTVVVFTSDHGDMCGEHGLLNKGVPFEASARIPFLISYPGKIKPGSVVHEALNTTDFKPTLLGLLGLPRDERDEGRDAATIFLTGKTPPDWKNITVSRHANGRWLMAVSSRYKLVVATDAEPSLFDLDQDPFELRNIFSAPGSRPIVRNLARALLEYARRCKEPHADHPSIRADLAWAVSDDEKYVSPQRDAPRKGKKRRNEK
ncbi:MAG: DUF229 domain-containing protein [Verrucomicrobia bacterium]|nr:DUF229 domain-containing protein [Verrucomicrobiota bacterium]